MQWLAVSLSGKCSKSGRRPEDIAMDNEGRANGETGKNPAAAFASSAPMYTDAAFCLLLPLETLDYDAVVQGTDLIPVSVMEEWSKTEPTERKAAEEKLKGEWDHWMSAHSAMILSTDAGGKTARRASLIFARAKCSGWPSPCPYSARSGKDSGTRRGACHRHSPRHMAVCFPNHRSH